MTKIEMSYSIYVHVNQINGKMYIGITRQHPEDRWQNGTGYAYNTHFSRAIAKYGWDNFDHVIFASGLTEAEACNMEKIQIHKCHTTDPRYGYNKHEGGNKPPVLYGPDNHQWHNHSQSGENHPMFGKKHTLKTKQKMSANHRDVSGAKNPQAKAVKCQETGKIYPCAQDAQQDTGINRHNITAACRRDRQQTAGGFHWDFVIL